MSGLLSPSRLRTSDAFLLGVAGLRARPARLLLSALGIAIGIAAMIAVVGISSSSRAAFNAELDRLGTGMLRIIPSAKSSTPVQLPADGVQRLEQIPDVEQAASYAAIAGSVYRNELTPRTDTNAISIGTVDDNLANLLSATIRTGRWLDTSPKSLDTAVLGSITADRLGVTAPGVEIFLDDRPVTVIGVLHPLPLAPELNTTALVSHSTGKRLGWDGHPTVLYERSTDDAVSAVRDRIGGTLAPGNPGAIAVSRPSDALAARAAADQAFSGMLIGLSGVALLVGGVGVANTMVIAVLERRREIGLRRALGATRGHIRTQFLTEALLLSLSGGVIGVFLGGAVVAIIAATNGWALVIPGTALALAPLATLGIGAIAGAYPAVRAARTPPTVALST